MNKDDAQKIAKLAVAPLMAHSRALLAHRTDRLKLSSVREGTGWRFTFAITEAASDSTPSTDATAATAAPPPATIWLDVLVSADGAPTVNERHALAALLAR